MIQVLEARTPKGVQKRRATKDSLPSGAARFLPNSEEYMDILVEWASRPQKMAKKTLATKAAKEKKKTKK